MNKQNNLQQKTQKPLIYRIGIILIVISLVVWVSPLVVPFLPLSVSLKASIMTGLIIVAEILFWTGVVFAGKEVVGALRYYLNPKNWCIKNQGEADEVE